MIWVTLFFILLAVLVGVPLLWAMLKVSMMRFEDAQSHIVDPSEVPVEVLNRLGQKVEKLTEAGFAYEGMRAEEHGSQHLWQAALSSAEGMVWAIVTETETDNAGQEVTLASFGSDGTIAVTRDGDPEFGPQERKGLFQSATYETPLALAKSHAEMLFEKEVAVQAVGADVFLEWLDRRSRRSLDYLFESGWLDEAANDKLKISLVKLPLAGFAHLTQWWKLRQRHKLQHSWLLGGVKEVPEEAAAPEEDDVAEDTVSEEAVESEEENFVAAESLPEDLVAEEILPSEDLISEESNELDSFEEGAFAEPEISYPEEATESIDLALQVESQNDVVSEEEIAESLEEVHDDLPAEDGLERDLALYQRQANEKSWAYWLRGYGGRAFVFVALLIFAVSMILSRGWPMQLLAYGFAALLIHEIGHAVVMLVRRSWDWSQFLIPIPHPMAAKTWSIKGGVGELLTVLAGPMPGFIFGWSVLTFAFFGTEFSEPLLNFALVCALLNSFTLLPILPLDGGRLLDLALLRTAPSLRALGLFLGGLVALAFAFLGGGLAAGVLALFLWFGIPSARRKSSLLPWMRANVSDDPSTTAELGLAVLREKGKAKLASGPGGAAKLDELSGIGQGKALGSLGSALALLIVAFALFGPLAFPVYEVAKRIQTEQAQEKAASLLADQYWKPRATAAIDPESESQIAKLLKDVDGKPTSNALSSDEHLEAIRFLIDNKSLVAWANANPKDSYGLVSASLEALRREAIKQADQGESAASFRDLSYAFRVLSAWEPSQNLDAWVAWHEQEREILKELADVSSRYQLADAKVKWFEDALTKFRQPTGSKIAALLLRDGKDLKTLLKEGPQLVDYKAPLKPVTELPPGKAFLRALRRPADILPFDNEEGQIEEANAIAAASRTARSWEEVAEQVNASDDLKDSLARVDANLSFRAVAISALRIKRLGPNGAQTELAKLKDDHGFHYQIVKEGERESLKMNRLSAAGERIEMEWLLRQ